MRHLHRNDDAFSGLLGAEGLAVFLMAQGVEDCNEEACRLTGRPRAELIGRSPLEFCPPLQPDGAASDIVGRQRVESALSGLPQWFEWEFVRPDGSRAHTLVHLEAITVGGARRLLLRVRDLSRLERAEQALADTESRLQQILENTTAVVFVKDNGGRYLFANRRFRDLFNRREAEIIGSRDGDLFDPELAERFRANDQKVLETREPLEVEEQAPHDDGVHTYLAVKFPLFDRAGNPYAVCGIATDITDRKRHEEALRDAALAVSSAEGPTVFQELVRYLATILRADVAFIAVHIGDCPDRLRMKAFYMDGRVEENFEYGRAGTPCETVVGRKFRYYASRLAELFPNDSDFRRLGLQSYAGFPLNDSRGQPLGLISVVSRGTLPDPAFTEAIMKIFAVRAMAEIERQQAEQALRDSEASYRAIFEASEDAIFVHDWDSGAIVDVNPKACATYGYQREELLRLGVADLSSGVPPYTAQEAARQIEAAKAGSPQRFEWHRRNRDGSLHWDEVSLAPANIAGRRRLLAITREITGRKEREEALKRSEARLRATIEAALDCVIGLDGSGTVIEFNAAAERCFGYRRDAALGRPISDLVVPPAPAPPPAGDCMAPYLAACGGPERGRRIEVTARRADGTVFPASLAIGIARSGEGDMFIAYLRDATERRRAEDERRRLESQLRQAQKMEAIGHLTGGIAHDFNNILTSIMGYVALAAERQARFADPRLGKYLEQAQLSCQRARDLIQQMLTFSRGRRGEPRPLSLAPLVRESVKLLRPALPATLELRTALQEDLPAVMLDPVQLEQILLNLCINARDATAGFGWVEVAARRRAGTAMECTSCRERVAGEFVELAVQDSGPGIPASILDRIFEPFFTTKEVGKGSGMGLSTVHGIVHEHGGHVVVESPPRGGACFRVLFPALAPRTGTDSAMAAPVPGRVTGATSAGRVLVVEDEEMVGEFMRDLLEGRGMDVTVLRDPTEALEAIRGRPDAFDLVITDQTMPRLTGLELSRAISRMRPSLPIILYTGYGEGIEEARLVESGVRALARKPVDPAALLELFEAQFVASSRP
ncbi:MAG TPA: PAS domain S-box protein [Burkholderiales bacterium]|nr:PAS domain S-box protein [Burkholderiales bacterium]